jgi:hypothetical protein
MRKMTRSRTSQGQCGDALPSAVASSACRRSDDTAGGRAGYLHVHRICGRKDCCAIRCKAQAQSESKHRKRLRPFQRRATRNPGKSKDGHLRDRCCIDTAGPGSTGSPLNARSRRRRHVSKRPARMGCHIRAARLRWRRTCQSKSCGTHRACVALDHDDRRHERQAARVSGDGEVHRTRTGAGARGICLVSPRDRPDARLGFLSRPQC